MTESSVTGTVKENAFEPERQNELKNFLQDEGHQALEQFSPGTHGCHELLDRTA